MKRTLATILIFGVAIALNAADILDVKGFKPESDTEIYFPENLYEYIDGAADNFLSYGFQQLQVRDFSFKNVQFSVELYNMGDPLNAFGIYKSEKPKSIKAMEIGAEGVISPPYQALLLKSIFYVKINVYEGELDSVVGKEILAKVADILPGKDSFPEQVKLLPAANKLPDSEGFVRESFLGMSFLKRCLFAKYQEHDSVAYQYFVIIPEKNDSPEQLWKKLASNWKSDKIDGIVVLWRKVPYKGYIGAVRINELLYGVADCKNTDQVKSLLKKLVTNFHKSN